jgi:hypothetical protein
VVQVHLFVIETVKAIALINVHALTIQKIADGRKRREGRGILVVIGIRVLPRSRR